MTFFLCTKFSLEFQFLCLVFFLFKYVIFHQFTYINNIGIVDNKASKHQFLSNNIFFVNILCFSSRKLFYIKLVKICIETTK